MSNRLKILDHNWEIHIQQLFLTGGGMLFVIEMFIFKFLKEHSEYYDFKEVFESEQILPCSVAFEIKTTSLCYFYIRSERECKIKSNCWETIYSWLPVIVYIIVCII